MSLFSAIKPVEIERPVLELSGDTLRASVQVMVAGAEDHGGIERYVDAVKLKSTMFQQALENDVDKLEIEAFMGLCTFMSTVRRRIGDWLTTDKFEEMRESLAGLFDDDVPVDARIDAFCERFPNDKKHRWVRDLATEMLHNTDPERFPLMNRWVWDRQANTGVLREIWHAENIDHILIIKTAHHLDNGIHWVRTHGKFPSDAAKAEVLIKFEEGRQEYLELAK